MMNANAMANFPICQAVQIELMQYEYIKPVCHLNYTQSHILKYRRKEQREN